MARKYRREKKATCSPRKNGKTTLEWGQAALQTGLPTDKNKTTIDAAHWNSRLLSCRITPIAYKLDCFRSLHQKPRKFEKIWEKSRKVFSNFLEFFGVSEQISDFGRSVWRARQCGNQLSCAIRSPFKSSPKGRKSSLFLHQWLKKPPSRHAEKPERHFGIRSNKTNGVMHYLKVLATGCVTRMVGLAD